MGTNVMAEFSFEGANGSESSGTTVAMYFQTMIHLFGYSNLVLIQNQMPIYANDVEGLFNYLKINYPSFKVESLSELTNRIKESDLVLIKFLAEELHIKVTYLKGQIRK